MKFSHRFNRVPFAAMNATLAALATSASAQAVAPAPQQTQPKDAPEPLFSLQFRDISVRDLLRMIDDACPQKILIGEAVVGKIRFISIKNKPLTAALDVVCRTSNLTWGYLNRDTIVVLPARAQLGRTAPDLSQVPLPPKFRFKAPSGKSFTIPIPEAPRYILPPARRTPAPGEMPNLGLRGTPSLQTERPNGISKDALPRDFNGQRYYIVPLQPDFFAAPEPQPYEQPLQPTE